MDRFNSTFIFFALAIFSAAMIASATGCELIASVDRSLINDGGGNVGGTAGMGGTTGGGGNVGGGGGPVCDPALCPGVDTECDMRACDMDDMCIMVPEPTTTGCTMAPTGPGAGFCDGVGMCVECNVSADCAGNTMGNTFCQANQCVPPGCGDGEVNGDETDLDCGGSCAGCANGLMCGADGNNCASGYCNAGTCAPCGATADCADVTGTWCNAGVCELTIGNGMDCTAGGNEQCTSNVCISENGQTICCEAACGPGLGATCDSCVVAFNGVGDGQCLPVTAGMDPNNECTLNAATCAGANCAGGVTACGNAPITTVCNADGNGQCNIDDTCDAGGNCPAAFATAGSNCGSAAGTCSDQDTCNAGGVCMPNDHAPGVNCGAGPAVCSNQDTCNGSGVCNPNHIAGGTPCGPAPGDCENQDTCDGGGTCDDNGFITGQVAACDPYLCDGAMAACPTSCMMDNECVAPATCPTMTICCSVATAACTADGDCCDTTPGNCAGAPNGTCTN